MKIFRTISLKAFLAVAILMPNISLSQEQLKKPVPLDPEVRYGKLENGLTYYIKHNEKTENRAEFYLSNDMTKVKSEFNHLILSSGNDIPGNIDHENIINLQEYHSLVIRDMNTCVLMVLSISLKKVF